MADLLGILIGVLGFFLIFFSFPFLPCSCLLLLVRESVGACAGVVEVMIGKLFSRRETYHPMRTLAAISPFLQLVLIMVVSRELDLLLLLLYRG